MSAIRQTSLISIWHHRVLGTLWALGGAACIAGLHRSYWGEQRNAFLPALVGLAYLIVGVGFLFRSTWARRAMAILLMLAGLLFAYWILAGLVFDSRSLLWFSLGGIGFTAYTEVFILCSASNHSV